MPPTQKTAPSPFGMLLIHREDIDLTKKLTVTLYGNDQGANNVLDAVAKAAEIHPDVNIVRIPGLNVGIPDGMREHLHTSSAAVFGISTGMPEAQLAAEALEKNPGLSGNIFFTEDFPSSSGIHDPLLRRIGRHARLCSIMNVPDDAAERVFYKSVHTVGWPDHWLPAMENIRTGAALRRSGSFMKRQRGSFVEQHVTADDAVVYVSGFRDPESETAALKQLLAIKEIDGRPLLVHFRPHPGERNHPDLQRAIRERDALLDGQWEIASAEIVDSGAFADMRLIGAADVTIAHPGATSTFLAAATRVKMICPLDLITARQRLESSYDYALTERNVRTIDRLSDLRTTIAGLLPNDSPEATALRKKQEKNAIRFDATRPPSYGKNVMEVMREFIT
ncbi:MAG: hypothetical protein HOO67_05250 [Candidatus Peribacteraceae bacterium]|nr:hypothetical protein [Candidatus Peribacteraceae bacterium]